MEGKKVYIVVNEGYIEGVFDSAEKAKAYMCKNFPNNYSSEEIEKELEEISDIYYYEDWTVN